MEGLKGKPGFYELAVKRTQVNMCGSSGCGGGYFTPSCGGGYGRPSCGGGCGSMPVIRC